MENRIDRRFQELAKRGHKAFVAYISAGDPNLEATPELVAALDRAGADVIELGIPFSDPLADGVVNQLAFQRALEAGATLDGVFEASAAARQRTEVPIVFFTYYNPVFAYGLEKFAARSAEAGVDGILILDLPPEESDGAAVLAQHGLKRISLIAPTSPEARIRSIAETSTGFIYYVSREGVTGMQSQVASGLEERLGLIRSFSDQPICVGFGISNPEQAGQVGSVADGVVVGSALVKRIGEWGAAGCPAAEIADRLENFVRPFADAVHPPSAAIVS